MNTIISENKGIFTGRITRISKLDKVSIVELMVHNEIQEKEPNFINFMFYKKHREEVEKFSKGQTATIEAHMTSFMKREKEHEKMMRSQCIVADKIYTAETTLEKAYGTKGRSFIPEKNEFYLAGIISRVWQSGTKGIVNVVVNVQNGLHLEPIKVTLFTKKADEFLEEYKEGDSICTVCKVQTSRKQTEEKTLFFENLIIRDYSKLGDVA